MRKLAAAALVLGVLLAGLWAQPRGAVPEPDAPTRPEYVTPVAP